MFRIWYLSPKGTHGIETKWVLKKNWIRKVEIYEVKAYQVRSISKIFIILFTPTN